MIDVLLRDLRQPEYVHVLINQLPLIGLAMGCIGLIVALLLLTAVSLTYGRCATLQWFIPPKILRELA